MADLQISGTGFFGPNVDMGQKVSEGLKLGQQARMQSALQGIDITDPNQMNKAASALVAGGQSNQINALSEYAMSGIKRKILNEPSGAPSARRGREGTSGTPDQLVFKEGQPVENKPIDVVALHGSIANDFEQAANMANDPVRFDAFKSQVREKYKGLIPEDILERELSGDATQMMGKAQMHRQEAQAEIGKRGGPAAAPAAAGAPTTSMAAPAAPAGAAAPIAGPSSYEIAQAEAQLPEGETGPAITPTAPGQFESPEMVGSAGRRPPAPQQEIPAATATAPVIPKLYIPTADRIPGTAGTAGTAGTSGTEEQPYVDVADITREDAAQAKATTGMSIEDAKYWLSTEGENEIARKGMAGQDLSGMRSTATLTMAAAQGAAVTRANELAKPYTATVLIGPNRGQEITFNTREEYERDANRYPGYFGKPSAAQIALDTGKAGLETSGPVELVIASGPKAGQKITVSSKAEAQRLIEATPSGYFGEPGIVEKALREASTQITDIDVKINGEIKKIPVTQAAKLGLLGGPTVGGGTVAPSGGIKQGVDTSNLKPITQRAMDILTDAGFTVTDAFRTEARNAATPGAAVGSMHQQGNALDFRVSKDTPVEVLIERMKQRLTSSGLENSKIVYEPDAKGGPHLHVDFSKSYLMGGGEGGSQGGAALLPAGAQLGGALPSETASATQQIQDYNANISGIDQKIIKLTEEANQSARIRAESGGLVTGPLGERLQKLAEFASPISKLAKNYAGKYQQLESDLSGGVRATLAKGQNVRNTTEFDAAVKNIPKTYDQAQRIQFYGSAQQATALYELAEAKARQEYHLERKGPSTEDAFQRYWHEKPAYKKGIWGVVDSEGRSPWAGVKLLDKNGKEQPLVEYKTAKNKSTGETEHVWVVGRNFPDRQKIAYIRAQ